MAPEKTGNICQSLVLPCAKKYTVLAFLTGSVHAADDVTSIERGKSNIVTTLCERITSRSRYQLKLTAEKKSWVFEAICSRAQFEDFHSEGGNERPIY